MAEFLECVVNVSEGRDARVLDALATACGPTVLDVHNDPDHHRAVVTVGGPAAAVEESVRGLAAEVVAKVDVSAHAGAHPRIGALDVVPFVNLVAAAGVSPSGLSEDFREDSPEDCPEDLPEDLVDGPEGPAVEARDRFARWAGDSLGLPCFLYGSERTLPDVRRLAWKGLLPDFGPRAPHPTAGAVAVGARRVLVAYNLWLTSPDLAVARRVAADLRGPQVRTLALQVGSAVQVSCNLIDPWIVGPGVVFDAVASRASISRAELVGLIPRGVLHAEPRHRWEELDLDPSKTIEARLKRAGLDGGRLV